MDQTGMTIIRKETRFSRMFGDYRGILPSLLFLFLFGIIFFSSDSSASQSTFQLFAKRMVPLGLLALGLYPVMICNYIDLSQFATAQLTSTVAILLINDGMIAQFTIPIMFFIGVTIGLINGLVISHLRIHPILVTYCMGMILKGIMFISTKGRMVLISQKDVFHFWRQDILGFPVTLIGFLILFLLLTYMMGSTILGRKFLALGGNRSASYFSGIGIHRIEILSFMISSVMSTIAGFATIVVSMSVSTGLDLSVDLRAIVILILGGTTFRQKGRPVGILTGLLVYGILESGLMHFGIPAHIHQLIKGSVLLSVIMINALLHRSRSGSTENS
jgi:ribose/xylose/arabinose/galactoside ABC-type transport system permease subunit